MCNDVPIYGIDTYRVDESPTSSYLVVNSEKPLRTLNSAPWGGGFQVSRILINRQVDKSYLCDDPLQEMDRFLLKRDFVPAECACMLTAARVADAGYSVGQIGDLTVCTWVTAGLGNPARSGMERPDSELFPGTINTIVLIDGNPTDAAMVNAVITATEAKAAVLQDLAVTISEQSRLIATGTTTDAVLIAATGRGRPIRYAGTATELGHLIGRTVYDAGRSSAEGYFRWKSGESV
jgi:adenosylcobinamide hydrolase